MKKITIEKVDNGFIVEINRPYDFTQLVFADLEPALNRVVGLFGEPGDNVTLTHAEMDEGLE